MKKSGIGKRKNVAVLLIAVFLLQMLTGSLGVVGVFGDPVPEEKSLTSVDGTDGKLYYKGAGAVGEGEAVCYYYGDAAAALTPAANTSIVNIPGQDNAFSQWRVSWVASSAKYLLVKFNVEQAGKYKLELGNRFKQVSSLRLQINGGENIDVAMSDTEDYKERWDDVGEVDLVQGINTLKITTYGITGDARFDTLRITPASAESPLVSPSAENSSSPETSPSAESSPEASPVISPLPLTHLTGQSGNDGNIYYKGEGTVNSDTAVAIKGEAESANVMPTFGITSAGGLTFAPWRLYMTGGDKTSIQVKIFVETAGRYKLEVGNKFSLPKSIYVNVNDEGKIYYDGASQEEAYKERWDTLGYFDFKEGVNTVEISPLVRSDVRFDILRLGDPSDEPEPEEAYFFDDADTTIFEKFGYSALYPDQWGNSGYGQPYNSTHWWSYLSGSYGVFTLKDLPAGKYELYFWIPSIHDNNTTEQFLNVSDSEGQIYETSLDLHTGSSIKAGDWYRLGGEDTLFILNAVTPGTVTSGLPKSSDVKLPGCSRLDAVKAVRVEEILMPPRAKNVTAEGIWRPGGVLTGKYEYIQDNGLDEKDTVMKWYRGDSKDAENWAEIGTGENYTLTQADADKYIKFEVTPACDTDNESIRVGGTYSYVTDQIPAQDNPGYAYNLTVEGRMFEGVTLSGTYLYQDSNLDPEEGSTYQWYRADTKSGEMTAIEGAAGSCKAGDTVEYTLTDADVGKYIQLIITARSSVLSFDTKSVVMGPVESVPIIVPEARWVTIAGTGTTERSMRANYQYFQENDIPEGNTQIQWLISDTLNGEYTPIPGATGTEYQATAEQKYKYIKLSVTPVSEYGWTGKTVISPAKQIKWNLSWYDEFDYYAEDGLASTFTEKWTSENYPQGHIMSGRYVKNVEVSDGALKLKQFHEDPPINGQNWTSGSVFSNRSFGYGYYEARYKYAPAPGLNQSFWLITPGGYLPKDCYELDMNEGHYPRTIMSGFHWNDGNDDGTYYTFSENFRAPHVDNLADEYHIYEMDWNRESINLYLDGILYRSIDNVGFAEKKEARLWFSEAVLAWAGEADKNQVDGSVMEVDYVRYYQTDGENFADTENLENMIAKAENEANSAIIGSDLGNYPKAAVETLKSAVNTAKETLGSSGLTTGQAETAYRNLRDALDEFYTKMSTVAVMTKDKNIVTLPNELGKEATIVCTDSNVVPILRVKQGTLLRNAVIFKTTVNVNGQPQTIEMKFPRNTSFYGETDSEGYVNVYLPRRANANSLDSSVSIPGKISDVITMGPNKVVSTCLITLPSIQGKSVGFVDDTLASGNFRTITATASSTQETEMDRSTPENGMAYISGTDTTISARQLTDLVIYTPSETGEGPEGPTNTNRPIGSVNPPYYPEGEPSPSEEPTASPSTTPTDSPADFKDIKGHWAEKEISELAEEGIVKGVTEDEFMPDKSITRAEFTALIVRTLGLELVDYKNEFGDVKKTDWFADEVQTAMENGIISKDEMFRPNDTMTREEMTKVMVEALKKATGEEDLEKADLGQFKDAEEISGWAKEYVAEALHTGLIKGISEEEFSPKTNATRAQGAVMIHRLLGMIAKG